MPDSAIQQAIKQICEEKNISYEAVLETIEAALAVAYRKDFGKKNENIIVHFQPETGEAQVFDEKIVSSDDLKQKYDEEMAALEAERAKAEAEGRTIDPEPTHEPIDTAKAEATADTAEAEAEPRWDPKTMVSLSEAQTTKSDAKLSDVIRTQLFPPEAYGRMAAQTAKQVIIQRLREAEREMLYKEFKDKEGKIINGTIQRIEGRTVLVDLGTTTAVLPPQEQIRSEAYQPAMRLKFFVLGVESTTKGPEIHISRSHPEMVRQLFAIEVPEIASGVIEIKAIAREGGLRTKIGVVSHEANVDPVGSCVGQRGSRVQTVISELGGEKIDIIEYDDDPVKFIINALSPAKVLSVKLNEKERTAMAEVKEDQLSLAIGKAGQNVRLAAKLTGWKIDIVKEESSEPVAAAPEASAEAPAAEVKAGEAQPAVVEEAKPIDEVKPAEETPAEKPAEAPDETPPPADETPHEKPAA